MSWPARILEFTVLGKAWPTEWDQSSRWDDGQMEWAREANNLSN